MMKLAEMTAQHFKCRAVITGESLGQVASQTMGALCVTDLAVSTLPVYRPLIAMDKEDIVKISRSFQILAAAYAVHIEMIQRKPAAVILIDNGKCRR